MDLAAADIVRLHDEALARWQGGATAADGDGLRAFVEAADGDERRGLAEAGHAAVEGRPDEAGHAAADGLRVLVEAGHLANFAIWGLEDEARRRDVGDARIAAVKRAIDPWNQRRNDRMEAVDAAILAAFANVDVSGAELHSETAGMMIDRLSILALKIHNMDRVAADAATSGDASLADECRGRAAVLCVQRADLAGCLDRLLADFAAGRRYFKRYLQLKAYNDERLNVALRTAAATKG